MRRLLAALAITAPTLLGAAPVHADSTPCQYILGFKTLHDLDPADIGDCTDNQAFAANGDAQQHTTKGLMAWRKADNWTAFTNGYMTWINGPNGLASRLNTQRFAWEANPTGLPVVGASAPASSVPSLPAANGQNWTIAFGHTETTDHVNVVNGSGQVNVLYATGTYLRIYFMLRNNESQSDTIDASDFKLTDAQGRTYNTDYQLKQVRPDGTYGFFDGSSVVPGTTVSLEITFDVAKDATGLVLHLDGGNDISVR